MFCIKNRRRHLLHLLLIILLITLLQTLLHLPVFNENKINILTKIPEINANLIKHEVQNELINNSSKHLEYGNTYTEGYIRGTMPNWQQKLKTVSNNNRTISVFLLLALQVRIYKDDKAKWTIRELKQWIHYVLWAGVEHIVLCDHYKWENETLEPHLKRYIDANLITYMDWSTVRRAMTAQVKCYQHIIDHYKDASKWQIAIDMDEYPYVDSDTAEGFLVRFLQKLPDSVSEVSMPNYLMLGQGDRSRDMVIERITRIKSRTKKSNALDKPIYRPQFVKAGLHHNAVRKGRVQEESGKTIKNLHYWGSRLQDWKPDTAKTFAETESFTEVRDTFGPIIRNSLLCFNENDAFSNITGP